MNDITTDLEDLALAVDGLVLAPDSPGGWVQRRERVVRTIRSYLIPRIRDPQRPLLVVFAGPTGAGKSTLLNSVAGAELSRTGPLRPTTKSPVVFAAEGRSHSYHRIGGVACKVVTGKARVLQEVTLVDTPDIDSTEADHRAMAEALIDNADLVIFVSSAIRYADLVPWEVLRRADSRGAPIIPVLNRIRISSDGALNDYRSLLRQEGIDGRLFAVPEYHMGSGRQLVPAVAVRGLRTRIVDAVAARDSHASNTLETVMEATLHQAAQVVDHAESRTEEAGSWNTRIDTLFTPDADRLGVVVPKDAYAPFDPAVLAGLKEVRRFRARRLLKRLSADAAFVDRFSESAGQAVTLAVEGDLRQSLLAAGAQQKLRRPIPAETHQQIREGAAAWVASLAQSLGPLRSQYFAPALAMAVVLSLDGDPDAGEALEALAPQVKAHVFRTSARWRLESEMAPVYEVVRLRVRAEFDSNASSRSELQEARAILAILKPRRSPAYA